jgi:hypothetical protein
VGQAAAEVLHSSAAAGFLGRTGKGGDSTGFSGCGRPFPSSYSPSGKEFPELRTEDLVPMILAGESSLKSSAREGSRMNEWKENLKRFGYVPVDEGVPPIGESVIVVAERFRCVGFLDDSMNWRYVRDHGLIHDVIGWGVLGYEEGAQ